MKAELYQVKIMNIIFRLVPMVFVLLVSSVVNADGPSGVSIKDIIVNSTSGIHFRTTEAMVNPSSETCTSTSWYKIEPDSAYEKELYSFLLSAQAQGKTITIHLEGCTGGYPKIGYVY